MVRGLLFSGSGTAGKYDVRGAWRRRHQLDPKARLDPGDARLVGKGRRPAPGVGWESKPLPRCPVSGSGSWPAVGHDSFRGTYA
jgi:hypothetical protein